MILIGKAMARCDKSETKKIIQSADLKVIDKNKKWSKANISIRTVFLWNGFVDVDLNLIKRVVIY